ncbi:MAG TPA: S46 family peptidase, partial [Caulobacteraceae bacterium]
MWPFDEAPVARVKDALGVTLDARWLDHLRDASVRLSSGCSASIVSKGGLILTNQHCIVGCAAEVSPPDRDYVADGFVAAGQGEERACPDVQAEVLVGIADVTAPIFAAGAGLHGEDYAAARQTAIADAERQACGGDPRFRCQVISFYQGGQFKLYKYRRYADVRLVFAPELDTAWFGGDPDNFNFPRFDLDCAFLRLYENGKPAATPSFLAWSNAPPAAGEPVFVSGNPGVTERRLTAAQLKTLRDVALPLLTVELAEFRGRLVQLAEQGPAMRRLVASDLFETENTYKVLAGRLAALRDPAFMAAREKEDADLKARLAALDPKFAATIGDPWSDIAAAEPAYARQFVVWHELEAGAGGGSDLYRWARELVRAAAESVKPTGQRLPEYADSRLPLAEKLLIDPKPEQPVLEKLRLEFWLSKTREQLGADAQAVTMLLGGESPEGLAGRLVAGSRLGDPAVRKTLWDGGMAAVAASDDPMIQFVLRTDPLSRAARQVWEEEVESGVQDGGERIARIRYAFEGASLYPDANFSLRLSYGKVAGWTDQGLETTPFTTFAGLYQRATGAYPYRLPARWAAEQPKLDQATVLDFSTTNDITGGSSGSPVVNAKGQLVGAAFDSNIHGIAGD